MKQLAICIALGSTMLFASCNNDGETTPAETKDTTSPAVMATPVAPPAPAAPTDFMEIAHTVKDYAIWKKAFDDDSAARKANSLDLIALGRSMDKPNRVNIVLNVADMAKAKSFNADPRLKDVMGKAGVISKPEVSIWHIIRINMDSKEKSWVEVTHKVKDYDAWLKGFDGEGAATRAANGMIDVALARGVDDPNLVRLVFDISDMAKAKARQKDPALKKIMMEAGVIGKPVIEFFSVAE